MDSVGQPTVKEADKMSPSPSSLVKYGYYGFDGFWIDELKRLGSNVWEQGILGPTEKRFMKVWLQDAGFVDKQGNPTSLFLMLSSNPHISNNTIASIAWVNLCYNSPLIRWAVFSMPYSDVTREEIAELMAYTKTPDDALELPLEKRKVLSKLLIQSVENFFYRLYFIGVRKGDDKKILTTTICQAEDVDATAFLYAMYKGAEAKGTYELTLSQLQQYAEVLSDKSLAQVAQSMNKPVFLSPLKMFPMTTMETKRLLRGLSTTYHDFMYVELIRDLDNIFLNRSKTSLDVVDYAVKQAIKMRDREKEL